MARLRMFAWQTGFDDGRYGRRAGGWTHPDDKAAYDLGHAEGKKQADVVGGTLGVCVIREDPETGERRVEYYGKGNE